MEIWIISEGEKHGPLRDFEVRRKIATGEMEASTMAWHDGLAQWTRLDEVPAFADEFRRAVPAATPPPLPRDAGVPQVGMASGDRLLWRRFWARWCDLTGYLAAFWLIAWSSGADIKGMLFSTWVQLFSFVPWFFVEAIFLHVFGNTPGKWLLGLSVRNIDGSKLSLSQALLRGMRILFSGLGMGFWILPVVFQSLSWFMARRAGKPLWDLAGGHVVHARSLHPLGVLMLIVCMLVGAMMQNMVVGRIQRAEMIKHYPQLEKFLDENAMPSLPERKK